MKLAIPYQTAVQHTEAHAAIERQIRSGNSKRKDDDLNSFRWSYETCVRHFTLFGSEYEVHACLVATSQGVNWSELLEDTPNMCVEYWKSMKGY